ncbi:MAG: hypothetical protein AB7J30_12515 [Hyphomicrobium sp.]|uniref:hypothetical protein n=1 Tax=Hyphomicrobium sp. TaxID=82 RepID=UPI003D143FDD
MSRDKPRARKIAQPDAFASGKRFDAAIGLSRLTPEGRGLFAPPVRRLTLQTMEVCCGPAPAGSTKILASMPIQ